MGEGWRKGAGFPGPLLRGRREAEGRTLSLSGFPELVLAQVAVRSADPGNWNLALAQASSEFGGLRARLCTAAPGSGRAS